MKPSMELIADPSSLKLLGTGLYARVYLQEDGTVLKISKGLDGSMDYIEWCSLRLKKYGKGSPEMAHLPEVEHFGRCKVMKVDIITGETSEVDGWWCVMPKYLEADESPPAKANQGGLYLHDNRGNFRGYIYNRAIRTTLTFIEQRFGWKDNLDIHAGNIMWDESRESWIVTDPCSQYASGTGSLISQDTRFKQRKTAIWKRTPLQCLHRH